MDLSAWVALAAVIISGIAVFGTYFGGRIKDAREEGKASAILTNIDLKLKEITDANLRYEGKFEVLSDRVIKTEESTKSAHHRIDELRDEIYK